RARPSDHLRAAPSLRALAPSRACRGSRPCDPSARCARAALLPSSSDPYRPSTNVRSGSAGSGGAVAATLDLVTPSRNRTSRANQPCNGGTTEEDDEPETSHYAYGQPHISHLPRWGGSMPCATVSSLTNSGRFAGYDGVAV